MLPLSKPTEAWLRWLANEPHRPHGDRRHCLLCKRARSDKVIHPPVWRFRRAVRHWLAGEPPMATFGTMVDGPHDTEE